MRHILKLVLSSVIFVLLGCTATSTAIVTKAPAEITGANDPLEDVLKVTTYGYAKPFMGVVNPFDYFFRGNINKKQKKKLISYIQQQIAESGCFGMKQE